MMEGAECARACSCKITIRRNRTIGVKEQQMPTHALDMAVLQFFQELESPLLDAFMTGLTKLGDGGVLWIALCLFLLARRRTRLWGATALGALIMSFFVDELLLKSIFLRERPFEAVSGIELIIDAPHGYSFPSSHSATACAVAACLLLCPRIKAPIRGMFVAFALLIALSRVYLSVHYLTDVVFGVLIGSACGILFGMIALNLQTQPWERIAPCDPSAVDKSLCEAGDPESDTALKA